MSLAGGNSARNSDANVRRSRTERRQGRVGSLSLKAAGAIPLAGHGGDAVTWLSLPAGVWTTSSAYTSTPVPVVQAFVRANPIAADYGQA